MTPSHRDQLEQTLSAALAAQRVGDSHDPHLTLRAQPAIDSQPVLDGLGEAHTVQLDTARLAPVETEAAPLEPPIPLRDVTEDVDAGRTLAQGGMGLVRLAHQHALEREVVIKSLRPGTRTPDAMTALLVEARLSGRLEHPNIIPIHTLCWSKEEGPVIVMKRVEGVCWTEPLHDDEHPFWDGFEGDRLQRHLEILLDVCNAVEYAHSRGIIHRDIKPDNVMVGHFGEVYLLDWGVAFVEGQEGPVGSHIIGTPHYMAPEMTEPERTVDIRTDIFLLGAVLHEVLVGRPRHTGRNLIHVLLQASAAAPCTYPDTVPEELGEICNRACHVEPDERYPTVAAFRAALTGFLRHRTSVQATHRALEVHRALVDRIAAAAPDDLDARLEVNRLFSAARSGFQHALDTWRENRRATDGLRASLDAMIRFELAGANVRSAELLLAEIDDPAPDLIASIEALRVQLDADRSAQARLTELKGEMRLHGLSWSRSLVTALHGTTVAAVLFTLSWILADQGPPSLLAQFVFLSISWIAIAVSVGAFRRVILDNKLYVRLMIVLGGLAPALILNRIFGFMVAASWPQTIAGDCLICCTFMVVLGATLARAFWISAIIAIVTSLLALYWIDNALDVIAVGYLVNTAYLFWLLRPGGQVYGALVED